MATLKDIAKESGVSTATVSYVLNKGPKAVLPATRDRVLRAVADLRYHPNPHARGLRGKKSNTLGIVFPHVTAHPFENSYFGPVLNGIMDVTTDRRLATMLFTGFTWEEAEQSVSHFCDGRSDALVLIAPPRKGRLIQELKSRGVGTVVIGTQPEDVEVTVVDANNVSGGRQAAEYLFGLGHRRIGIALSEDRTSCSRERFDGFRQGLANCGCEFDPRLAVPPWGPHGETQRELLEALFKQNHRPTAIFCVQDWIAGESVKAAQAAGLHVPTDMSIVGFDDSDHIRTIPIPLTCIRQPMRQIGLKAAELACDFADNPDRVPEVVLFDVQLIPRETTAPPKGAA